jgi:hypothetical protein
MPLRPRTQPPPAEGAKRTLYVPQEDRATWRAAQAAAEKMGKSLSSVVVTALEEWLERKGGEHGGDTT